MQSGESLRRGPHNLVAFFVLAYAISWSIGVPLALANQGIISPVLPTWAHYFFGYGPMIAALLVAGFGQGRSSLKDLYSRVVLWNVRPIWWIAALSPLIVGFVVAIILNAFMASKVSLSVLGQIKFLPPLGIGALLLWLLTFGIGEELGWRGFALPRLQNGRSAFRATVILWFFWALWHLPAFFYLYDPGILIGFLIGQFAGAILFTWLFNSAGGSVLIVAVWHGCFNYVTSTNAGDGLLAAVVSTAVMVWAVVILMVFKTANLSGSKRVVV